MTGIPDNDAPTPAEHLRRIANCFESAQALMALVGDDVLPRRMTMAVQVNLFAGWCHEAASEWGKRQAAAVARVVPT